MKYLTECSLSIYIYLNIYMICNAFMLYMHFDKQTEPKEKETILEAGESAYLTNDFVVKHR